MQPARRTRILTASLFLLAFGGLVSIAASCGMSPGPYPAGDDAATPAPSQAPSGPRRLLHFQTVGYSDGRAVGKVAKNVCTRVKGWQIHVNYALEPLVREMGRGSFDWWGSNPGGVWDDTHVRYSETVVSKMRFNQLELARKRFPKLVDYRPLADFAKRNHIDLYAYIGAPLCDSNNPKYDYEVQSDHCEAAKFMTWYGEFVRFKFKGVAHDATSSLPADSGALTTNFPLLEQRGMMPFIEAVPARKYPHLLGLNVVATERRWLFTEKNPKLFFSEKEINAAGGRTIHLVVTPPKKLVDKVDKNQWRFDTCLALLRDGKTVATPLDQLQRKGIPIKKLADAARRQAPDPPQPRR
jgi:hypothetical protein